VLPHQFQLIFRPYIAREWPGWGKLMTALGIADDSGWRNAPTLSIPGKSHGYLMQLDLRDGLERQTYFLGRYYDLQLQLLLDALLKPGDTFLDIGANIGMTALHGARLVGESGRVIAFEPQPACCDRIRQCLDLNRIRHVQIQNVGLADKDSELVLKILGGGTIMACFAVSGDGLDIREEIRVPVRRGDEVVRGQIVGNLVIKVDVEGYELFALQGLSETIDQRRPPIIAELSPAYLKRAGADENQVLEFFKRHNYRGFHISLDKNGILDKPRCALRPVDRLVEHHSLPDFLWLPNEFSFESLMTRLH
jgi:FkbM family methyltransferase